jgi:hypothetical protein
VAVYLKKIKNIDNKNKKKIYCICVKWRERKEKINNVFTQTHPFKAK